VLHIATVHYESPRWIEIQTSHLRRHISVPYQTWTSLQYIDPSYSTYFDRVIQQRGSHGEKLNHLALEISHEAADSDLLMFLDGDAFPIADLTPLLTDGLTDVPLVAVRRAENANEPQPHPCFCLTTVGAWRELHGDWTRGYTWAEVGTNRASDVGANLLRALELSGTPWGELLRSNVRNPHPLFFAVYGDLIYHHGAGFRTKAIITRHDREGAHVKTLPLTPVPGLRSVMRRINQRRVRSWRQDTQRHNLGESDRMFERIASGDPDWLAELIEPPERSSA
jgi:hypothetical protein